MRQIKGKKMQEGGFSKSSTKSENSNSPDKRSVIGEKRAVLGGGYYGMSKM
jgi:hypothetical protein